MHSRTYAQTGGRTTRKHNASGPANIELVETRDIHSSEETVSSVYSPGIFFVWGVRGIHLLRKKNLHFPQMAAKLCALDLLFGRDNELRIYHGNFHLMDNKHSKLFVIKQ